MGTTNFDQVRASGSIRADGGLFDRGLPVIGAKGNVYHVDSGHANASDSNPGTDPNKPLATIDAAIGKCTANNGDIILVSEGHAETLAAKITADVAGVLVLGLGHKNNRPALTVGAVIDGIDFTAADVIFENFRFPTPTAAATAIINIAAARSGFRRCRFELGANVVDAVTVTAAGEEPIAEDCEVIVLADGPDSWIKFEGVVDKPSIKRNLVIGSDGTDAFDDGVIDFNNQAVANPEVSENTFLGAGVATTVIANGGAVVGGSYGPNRYAGSAVDADNISGGAANLSAITDELSGANGIASFPNAAIPADGVSLAEVIRQIYAALEGTAAGQNGVATWPTAAAPGNNVSLAEAIRAIYDRQLGDGSSASANTRLGKKVTFAAADVLDGVQNALFTIAGGRVLITSLSAEVSGAAVDNGANNTQFISNPTVGTDMNLCAVLDIDGDEEGTIYSISGIITDAMTGGSGGGAMAMQRPIILAEGTIDIKSAADGGAGGALLSAECWYIPLDDGATVS